MELDYAEMFKSSLNFSWTDESRETRLHPLLIQCVMFSVCFFVGLLGHATVAFLIIKRRTLQTISNLYLLNFSISNAISLVIIPVVVITIAKRAFILGRVMCIIASCLQQVPIFTNSMFLTFITIDCYVDRSRKHHQNHAYRSAMLKVVTMVTWVGGAFIIIPISFATVYVSGEDFQYCIRSPLYSPEPLVCLGCMLVLILVPLIVMWVYVSTWLPPSKVGDSPDALIMQSRRLVVALVLAFTLCQVPYWLHRAMDNIYSMPHLHYILLSLPDINMAINPILITVYNKDMRLELISCLPKAFSRILALDMP